LVSSSPYTKLLHGKCPTIIDTEGTKKEVSGINLLMGYKEIEIYSPMEVIEND